MSEIKTVAVLGMGTMGSGIAQVCAQAGLKTRCYEIKQELVDKGLAMIHKNLDFGLSKGKFTEENVSTAKANLHPSTDLKDLNDVDLVIEAVVEDIAIKQEVFAQLDKICPEHTLLASNTSSLSITEIAAATQRTDRVLGLHFFNPAYLMKLVEVVKGLETSEESVKLAYSFVEKLGKTAVLAKDTPGFIVNLLLIPYLLDAARVYENGLATAVDIDNAMKLGAGYPMGPLTLMDMIGIDVCVKVGDILFDAYHEPKYNVPPLMRRMVMAGHLGRKSGRGFYAY
ncbi:3-hydroxybutyryl-CoA dehydrogenase [bacterium (Candidatus Blackallbacteria) CG17_big_fil_post_rev_8_21_14_2_50_48_46]|uniref:3-hydroxybutyryl-CoA dehydrogenase n=1 Tax=bacterium (Candidatus Blackallbacteria) CG17_big_fil_post_rev_8_21_14_2_50_48_46 TaxID=2014261 RepID=A0A2M7GBA2_9BACT|nr:MAG: 3-hydroxybutyryl-CoA dehydrogenase [bacterium (Candidatus Blackallbacteria) CG18_big_fil_WC_8_21_14_2_50_49_26]PIW19469.1 MAG: 3-hydroxybutyryl-CoA dehydrogenase [bacterium (Candidatus Blackallbacteria) CG17_big_fil_post_rev_8_21_14_2_50_48_46]PIW48927.1 MAG: 3-hydroxybutyryl-CoA dehydrogenase [bacterium (Candidatus Blackallbacteria) CG13_big_fil_rev_8_21_14_2_50_49_14]